MVMGVIGGCLIGIAAVWLYLSLGRISGISGIASNALLRTRESLWPLMFVIGLGVGGWAAYATGERPVAPLTGELAGILIVAGLLVALARVWAQAARAVMAYVVWRGYRPAVLRHSNVSRDGYAGSYREVVAMKNFSALLAGILFGGGLVVAGMTDPLKVLAFLTLGALGPYFDLRDGLCGGGDFSGLSPRRHPDGATVRYAVSYAASPVIDKRLLGGAAMFGVGWGLQGSALVRHWSG